VEFTVGKTVNDVDQQVSNNIGLNILRLSRAAS
jgi:hypothetical protein